MSDQQCAANLFPKVLSGCRRDQSLRPVRSRAFGLPISSREPRRLHYALGNRRRSTRREYESLPPRARAQHAHGAFPDLVHIPWPELPTPGNKEDKLHALIDEARRYEGLFAFYGCDAAVDGGVYGVCAGPVHGA